MNLFIKIFDEKRRYIFVLGILLVLSVLLRVYLINNNLFFGPEQGRDLLVVKDLVINHKLVLIGPKTAVDGIFHGPLYYYLATIPFILSNGSPLFIEYFFIFLNSLTVIFIYLLTKEIFNRKTALISSTIFTFSFGAIVMSRWLSHPPLIIPISSLFFLFLVKFLKGNKKYLIFTALFFGLASQTEFANFLIFSFMLLFLIFIFWKNFLKTNPLILILSALILFITTFINFILFDLRHKFLITYSFIGLLTKHSGFYGTFTNSLTTSIANFTKILTDSISPGFAFISVFLFVAGLLSLIINFKKDKFISRVILFWALSPFIAFLILKYNPLYHYFAVTIVAFIILIALFISLIYEKSKILGLLILFLVCFINLFYFFKFIPINKNVFFQSTQEDLNYSNQIQVIKRIYEIAGTNKFFYQSYTIPYWLQEEWQYLFWYYATTNNKEIPQELHYKKLFVIIQNDPSGIIYQNNWLKNTVSKWGKKEFEFKTGALRVYELNYN